MKVSIIVPIYNAEKYLEKCLSSLVCQSFTDFEIILIDDGSSDKSRLICEDYKNRYNNIVFVHKENGGSASARNLGLSIAKGEYISFVDADDYVKIDFIERLVQLATKYNADLVECSFQIVKEDSYIMDKFHDMPYEIELRNNIEMLEAFCNKKEYLKTAVLWNKLIRKDIIRGLKFVEGKGIDDEYLIHKILYNSNITVVTNEILYFYFMSDGSQMRSGYSLKFLDSIDAIERQLRFFQGIENLHLYNMLLYRYYSIILYNYFYIKKYYKNEKDIRKNLKKKRTSIYKALIVNETPFNDKAALILKRFFPYVLYKMKKGKVDNNEKNWNYNVS